MLLKVIEFAAADKGLFVTTGRFTKDAEREAVRDGAPTIDLIDGIALSKLLKDLELAVSSETVEVLTPRQKVYESIRDAYPDRPVNNRIQTYILPRLQGQETQRGKQPIEALLHRVGTADRQLLASQSTPEEGQNTLNL